MKRAQLPRSVILVVAFYLVAAITAAITQQNWEFLKIYLPFVFVTAAAISFMHRRVNFSPPTLWFLVLWGALLLAGRLIVIPETWPHQGDETILCHLWLIGRWLRYDHLVHFLGFATATWLIWEALRASIQGRLGRKLYPSLGMIILCILSGLGLSVISEFIALIATLTPSSTTIPSCLNTGWDFTANLAGCLLAGLMIAIRG